MQRAVPYNKGPAVRLTGPDDLLAQTKAPEPDYTLSFNAGAVTDYRYRGISQTRLKPALRASRSIRSPWTTAPKMPWPNLPMDSSG